MVANRLQLSARQSIRSNWSAVTTKKMANTVRCGTFVIDSLALASVKRVLHAGTAR